MEQMTVGIYVPSYRRWNAIKTYHLFEKCTYLVRKSQAQNYLDAGIKPEDLWSVDDELIDDGIKAHMYPVLNAKEDIVVIIDDDVEDIIFRLDKPEFLHKDKERITDEVYRIAQLLYDLDIGMAYNAQLGAPYNYTAEFTWKGIPAAMKWYNPKRLKARPDLNVSYNFDVDMIMQELLANRITLEPRYFCDKGMMDTNEGGNTDDKKRQDMIDSIENMKLKWGKYFTYDLKTNTPKIQVQR